MRPQFCRSDDDTTPSQVPSTKSDGKSRRKMDKQKYMGRGIFKNPPQPHMCIQDSLLGSKDPCFINVLSWEKISMPANPNDPIPLYGGIRIFNNSMNAIACSNLWQSNTHGEQPVIFAVLANTETLKLSGKTATDPNDREALIYLILDFIEVMNEGVQFQHHFKVLPDRDVVGELKDIWFIIQSKRDQDRMELAYNGEGDRGFLDRPHGPTRIHKKDTPPTPDELQQSRVKDTLHGSEQEKEKLSRSHSYPNGNSSKGGGMFFPSFGNKQKSAGALAAKTTLVSSNEPQKKVLIPAAKKITDIIPAYHADEEEIVLWETKKGATNVFPDRSTVAFSNSSSSSSSNHSKNISRHTTDADFSQSETLLTFSESLENKVRGEIFTHMKNSDTAEVASRKQVSHRREKISPPSFSEFLQKEILKYSLDQGKTKLSSTKQSTHITASDHQHKPRADSMRLVTDTEVEPSLNLLGNATASSSKQSLAIIPNPPTDLKDISHYQSALQGDGCYTTAKDKHAGAKVSTSDNVASEHGAGKISPTQSKKLTNAPDSLNGLHCPIETSNLLNFSSTAKTEMFQFPVSTKQEACKKMQGRGNGSKKKVECFKSVKGGCNDNALGGNADAIGTSKMCSPVIASRASENAEYCRHKVDVQTFYQLDGKIAKSDNEAPVQNIVHPPSLDVSNARVQDYVLNTINRNIGAEQQIETGIANSRPSAGREVASSYSMGLIDKKDTNENVKAIAIGDSSDASTPFAVSEILPGCYSLASGINENSVVESNITSSALPHSLENNMNNMM